MMTINELMDNYHVNLTMISKKSGISKTTLSNAFKRPITSWTIRILNGVAASLDETPEKTLSLLQGNKFKLDIDDKHQTIQGVHIPDHSTFLDIKFTVKNNVMEGWEPTREDIESLKAFAETQYPELEQKFNKIFGKDNE